ncbi:hypothetical protein Tco_0284856 [Tanacetum coccineum]
MQNPEDIFDPTTIMNMALVLMAKVFKLTILQQPTTTKGFHPTHATGRCMTGYEYGSRQTKCKWLEVIKNVVQNPGVQNVGNQNGLIVVLGIANQNATRNRNGNVVVARAEGDLDEIEEVNANCILMANL